MLLKASKSDPPVGAIIVGQVTKNCMVKWEAETSLDIGDGVLLNTGASIIRLVISSPSFIPNILRTLSSFS